MLGCELPMRLGAFAGDEIIERLVGQHADGGIHQRGIDVAALAGLLALRQRGQDADHRIEAGEDVGDRHADAGRRAVRHAGQIHHAAHALRHQIVAGALGVGAVLAEAGHRAIDQTRIFRRQALVVEAELGEPADLEILDQHVRALASLRTMRRPSSLSKSSFDRALAAVGGMEIGRADMLAVGAFHERRPPAAGIVAGAFALDLDDVGAQVGQHLPRPGPGQDAGKFEDAETRQRLRHEFLEFFLALRGKERDRAPLYLEARIVEVPQVVAEQIEGKHGQAEAAPGNRAIQSAWH